VHDERGRLEEGEVTRTCDIGPTGLMGDGLARNIRSCLASARERDDQGELE
jgi:hypothetical protein